MKRLRFVMLLLGAVCASCAADGGPGGTGISSTAAVISGNVVNVQTNASAAVTIGAAALPRIRVSLDGLPDLATTADSNGNFSLSGDFAGSVTVRFTVPQFQVTQPLDVPPGSAIILQDIELGPDGVMAEAARQLGFYGTVDLVDCVDGTLLLHGRPSDGMQFLVHLDNQTTFVDAAGATQTCAAIAVGSAVTVEGSIAYAGDRTITALVVTIAPPPPPPPQGEVEARFSGAIVAFDCTAGFIVVDDSVQRTSVQLTAQTKVTGMGATTCSDLHLGDGVRGEGQIDLRMPGVIVATHLALTGSPHSGQSLRFMGIVTSIDCGSGMLRLRDHQTAIDVMISSATVITRRNGQVLRCADIQPGDRVSGLGPTAADASGALDALQMTVMPSGLGDELKTRGGA
jgi:hypothetical protein